jgi:hypothetical protein
MKEGKKKYRNFTFSVMTKLGAGAGSETDWGKLLNPDPDWNQ